MDGVERRMDCSCREHQLSAAQKFAYSTTRQLWYGKFSITALARGYPPTHPPMSKATEANDKTTIVMGRAS